MIEAGCNENRYLCQLLFHLFDMRIRSQLWSRTRPTHISLPPLCHSGSCDVWKTPACGHCWYEPQWRECRLHSRRLGCKACVCVGPGVDDDESSRSVCFVKCDRQLPPHGSTGMHPGGQRVKRSVSWPHFQHLEALLIHWFEAHASRVGWSWSADKKNGFEVDSWSIRWGSKAKLPDEIASSLSPSPLSSSIQNTMRRMVLCSSRIVDG